MPYWIHLAYPSNLFKFSRPFLVANVLTAERVPKSNKLLNLASEQRQSVAGIVNQYTPVDVVGKTIVVVANLKPANLMGVESQGMVLAAGGKDLLGLVTFGEGEIDPGTQVR